VIVGGGLAGCLAALALARLRPEVPLLLLEQGAGFGGNHVWSFFDADVAEADRWLVEPIIAKRWPGYDICFPRRQRTLATGYNSVRSELLDALVRERLRPDQYRTRASIASIDRDGVTLEGGERIAESSTRAAPALTRSTRLAEIAGRDMSRPPRRSPVDRDGRL
jgi:lycopene beta-cyclase